MNRRLLFAAIAVFAILLTLSVVSGYADSRSKQCDKGYKSYHGGDLSSKFYMKAHMILKNEDELGLSEEQHKMIKDLKVAIKKQIITKKAEIDVIAVDIKSMLYDDKIDTAAIDKLIDQKYELKKEKAKILVGAYATLKNSLKEDQLDKLKGLYKECEKGK